MLYAFQILKIEMLVCPKFCNHIDCTNALTIFTAEVKPPSLDNGGLIMREAMFYEPMADNKVRCHLCNHLFGGTK